MAVGDVTAPEGRVYQDHETGTRIHQLTRYDGHSHHLYFTNSGLFDAGRRLLIGSHRQNRRNYYSVELASGELTQLTDFAPDDQPGLLAAYLNPVRDEAYFRKGDELLALGLHDGALRPIHRVEPEAGRRMNIGSFSCSADGRTVCTVLAEDLSDRLHLDMGHGYVGFAEYSAARPLCRIVAIDVESGRSRLLHEEPRWFTHLNGSTKLPDVFTVCHEGPWDAIEQRMWRLTVSDGSLVPLRPQVPDEAIGHEYWFVDGERLGFHGRKAGVHLFGHIRFDGSDHREYDFPHGSFHFHSMDETLIVGDGHAQQPWLMLWKLVDGRYEGPRRLLTHRGSWHVQFLHVHPRMFAGDDGATRVVYTADPQGYGNVYVAEVGQFESLPRVSDPPLAR